LKYESDTVAITVAVSLPLASVIPRLGERDPTQAVYRHGWACPGHPRDATAIIWELRTIASANPLDRSTHNDFAARRLAYMLPCRRFADVPRTPAHGSGPIWIVTPSAHTLSPSPIRDLPHRRLQPFRYLHDCSGCFRLERLVAGDLHTEKRRLLTEHTQCVIGDNWARYVPGWCGGASTARDRPTQRSGALNVASGVADDGEFNGEASFQVESAKGRIGVCAPGALKRTYDSPIFRSYLN
jgi:hypothetical protein